MLEGRRWCRDDGNDEDPLMRCRGMNQVQDGSTRTLYPVSLTGNGYESRPEVIPLLFVLLIMGIL